MRRHCRPCGALAHPLFLHGRQLATLPCTRKGKQRPLLPLSLAPLILALCLALSLVLAMAVVVPPPASLLSPNRPHLRVPRATPCASRLSPGRLHCRALLPPVPARPPLPARTARPRRATAVPAVPNHRSAGPPGAAPPLHHRRRTSSDELPRVPCSKTISGTSHNNSTKGKGSTANIVTRMNSA